MKPLQALVLCLVAFQTASAQTPPPARLDYNRDVRPILSENCFTCHGPSLEGREAELRLDVAVGAMAERAGRRPAIVPGDAAQSELYRRITADDPDERMPRSETGKQLTQEQIAVLRQWIDQGAEFQSHWSFVTPKRPALPKVTQTDWPRNAVDRFILARLEGEGLSPSAQADRRTLIRRVTFDLTGLPPTTAAVEVFVADTSDDAYERLVDRLLRSPRYGEHMARFWLDAARYGDTHGLHLDNYREMWPYRDWVINAFNTNRSFDRFVTEQLAGDLLEDPTLDQLIATGFNRCNVTTNEGGSIAEEVYVRNVVDRVNTTGTVFLGLSFECSRCHDHKYDPITSKDFYRFFAFFNNLDGPAMDGNRKDPAPVVKVASPEVRTELAALQVAIRQIEARMDEALPEVDAGQAKWETELRARLRLEVASAKSSGPDEPSGANDAELGQVATPATLGPWHSLGPFSAPSAHRAFSTQFPPEKEGVTDLSRTYAGGELAWKERPEIEDGKSKPVEGRYAAVYLLRRIEAPTAREMTVALDGNGLVSAWLNGRWVMSKEGKKRQRVTLWLDAGENTFLVKVCNGRYRSDFSFKKVGEQSGAVPTKVAKALDTARESRTDAQRATLRRHYRRGHWPEWKTLDAELRGPRQKQEQFEITLPTTLVFKERAERRDAFLLKRGEYDQHGEKVTRNTPMALPPMADDLSRDRLGLAKWLLDPDHPLMSRVTVNRFWQQCFGTGLVKTAENFGAQGESPSHPALLDWLAVQFIADGWDVKKLLKRFVMSATYRQSARVTSELVLRDPENRLLARGPRFRLDAEMLRDQALAVGDLLAEQIGGPGVKPPQPDGLWFAVGYTGSNTVRFVQDEGSDKVYRRSLYTFWKRTAPPPQMNTFDAPSREACAVRRERTNTPLQALLLMNDVQYVEAARNLAELAMRNAGDTPEARAAYIFTRVVARPPDAGDMAELVGAYADQREFFRGALDEARQLIAVGESKSDPSLDPSELAAWTMVANLILNLDEVITKG